MPLDPHPDRKTQISSAFSKAAGSYDHAARLQRRVVSGLAARVLQQGLSPSPEVLEIGCGTGSLSQTLMHEIRGGEWLLSDLSGSMLERARQKIGEDRARFRILDGEAPDLPEQARFDLICSSLAVQWFEDPVAACRHLTRFLAPEGLLAIATLGEGSFVEWREAHERAGLPCGIPDYLPAPAWGPIPPKTGPGEWEIMIERVVLQYDNAHDFIQSLKMIGADVPRPGHIPLNPGQMRRLLRQFDQEFFITHYIYYIFYRAP